MAKKKEPDKVDELIGELTKDATAEELLKDADLLRQLKKRKRLISDVLTCPGVT